MTTTPFTTFAFAGTGRSATRNMPDRIADVFNVKDYGATGNFSTDDSSALEAAVAAWAGQGILFFPNGGYKVTRSINVGGFAANTCGRIVGCGKFSTTVFGDVPNGFIFYQDDDTNGFESLEHMTLHNQSTWIGSGALMLNNSSAVINECHFRGMICVLLPWNIYSADLNNLSIESNSDVTSGYNGTLGIAGFTTNIKDLRCTVPFMSGIQLAGSNPCTLIGNSIENCSVAVLLGSLTGWGSHCTVAGNVLTVQNQKFGTFEERQFQKGKQIFGRGIIQLASWGADPTDNTKAVTIIDDHDSDATLTGVGWAGTYRLSQSFGTLATPVPMWTRIDRIISGISIYAMSSEACYTIIYLNGVAGCVIDGAGGGSTPVECVDIFGTTGLTARCGIYLKSAGNLTLNAVSPNNNPYLGSIAFEPVANLTNVTLISCGGQKLPDNVVTGTISNGSGGAGKILNVTAFTSGSGIGVGMRVTGSGVNTTITKNHLLDPTYTGAITTGTYEVADSLNFSSGALVVHTGYDWLLPTASSAKTGLQFINCGSANLPAGITCGLNTLNRTVDSLPGQSGANTNVPVIDGMEFDIVDGQKTGTGTALFGDIVIGGGAQHIKVRYNGTNWTRCG